MSEHLSAIASSAEATRQPRKVALAPVEHFAGARHTRTTWMAIVVFDDESEVQCGHEQHRTTAAAAACGRAVWKRERAKAL